jgi:enoyl-CoA hydratase
MDLKAFLRGESVVVGDRGLGGLTKAPPRKPLVAAVEGWALAGGFEMLLACDLIVASETARFGVPEVKRALVAGAGASLLLAQRIPYAAAMEILLTGEPFDAARAQDLGLLNRVVAEGRALETAVELAQLVAANGPYAVAVTKQIARSARDWGLREMWAKQDAIMLPVFDSEDAKEGALAFAEKREPVWKGR